MFQSSIGDIDSRVCTECGRDPSLGVEAISSDRKTVSPATAEEFEAQSELAAEREKHSLRNRKRGYLMPKLFLGWSVFLILIVLCARRLWNETPREPINPVATSPSKTQRTEEEIAFLNEAAPLCNQTLSGFLNATTPEERNQFVLAPITTASRMARFYGLNPLAKIDPSKLSLSQSAELDLPSGKAVETFWKSSDDRQFDAVFVKEGGEWRLDWDHFVRFSDYPWALFQAGSGDPQGEFRLFARERLAEERKNQDTISIVLYAPRFGSITETGSQSPEFLVKRDSEDGRLLDAAFKLAKKGERVFGVKVSNTDPEGLIRVRVKIRRIEENRERHFELEKVVACHWYSIDDPDVKPTEAPAAQPLEK
ncbi:MAG: hypothetical protein ABI162_18860 [Luteolibacter sp.]